MQRQVTIQYLNDESELVRIRPVLTSDQIARLIKFVDTLEEEDEDAGSSD